jgi:putative NADPH-quinone reductase
MPRLAIIQGHPVRAITASAMHVPTAYEKGPAVGGHEVMRIEVRALRSQFCARKWSSRPVICPRAGRPQRAIVLAQHLVMIVPPWQRTMPALLKVLFDRPRPRRKSHAFHQELIAIYRSASTSSGVPSEGP